MKHPYLSQVSNRTEWKGSVSWFALYQNSTKQRLAETDPPQIEIYQRFLIVSIRHQQSHQEAAAAPGSPSLWSSSHQKYYQPLLPFVFRAGEEFAHEAKPHLLPVDPLEVQRKHLHPSSSFSSCPRVQWPCTTLLAPVFYILHACPCF